MKGKCNKDYERYWFASDTTRYGFCTEYKRKIGTIGKPAVCETCVHYEKDMIK